MIILKDDVTKPEWSDSEMIPRGRTGKHRYNVSINEKGLVIEVKDKRLASKISLTEEQAWMLHTSIDRLMDKRDRLIANN